MERNNLRISVIGDSISTYEGWTPYGFAVYYKDDIAYENGINCIGDMWWRQVLDCFGGELCVNNSYSGCLVAYTGFTSASSVERCSLCGDNPDVILIYVGTNDRGYGMNTDDGDAPESFYGGYRIMLRRLKANYPSAKIICATLLTGYKKGLKKTVSDEERNHAEKYNAAIRRAVKDENCILADIALSGERYETLDYCHPTKAGHSTIAKLWIEKLKGIL